MSFDILWVEEGTLNLYEKTVEKGWFWFYTIIFGSISLKRYLSSPRPSQKWVCEFWKKTVWLYLPVNIFYEKYLRPHHFIAPSFRFFASKQQTCKYHENKDFRLIFCCACYSLHIYHGTIVMPGLDFPHKALLRVR